MLDADEDLDDEAGDGVMDPSLSTVLGGFAGSNQFSDVNFIVGKGVEQRCIPAHRVVLAASSGMFEAMLYPTVFPGDPPNPPLLLKHDDDPPEIELPDMKPAAFRTMIRCMYSPSLD